VVQATRAAESRLYCFSARLIQEQPDGAFIGLASDDRRTWYFGDAKSFRTFVPSTPRKTNCGTGLILKQRHTALCTRRCAKTGAAGKSWYKLYQPLPPSPRTSPDESELGLTKVIQLSARPDLQATLIDQARHLVQYWPCSKILASS